MTSEEVELIFDSEDIIILNKATPENEPELQIKVYDHKKQRCVMVSPCVHGVILWRQIEEEIGAKLPDTKLESTLLMM